MEFPSHDPARRDYSTVPRTRGVYAVGEMKYFDTEGSTRAIPASSGWTGTEFPPNVGTPTTLFCPTVGSAINQRIGRSAKVHCIRIRGTIRIPQQANITSGDQASQIRLLLVQDDQTNAAQAQGEEIMVVPSTATGTVAVNSFMNLSNLGRFKILKDKSYILYKE